MKRDVFKVVLIFIITLILAFTLLIVFACCFDRVGASASAESQLPADGYVGNNYLINNGNFTNFNNWSYPSAFSSISAGAITFSGQTSQTYPFQPLSRSFNSGTTLTYSLYVTSITGRVYIWCRDVSSTGITSNIITSGVFSYTFTLNATGVPQFAFSIPVGSSITFTWVKAETGSYFTGYVSKSFIYNGYSNGVTDGESNVQRYNNGNVVAGNLIVPNSTNYPDVTLTNGQVGAGGFRYTGSGDATTTSAGLEVYSSNTASTLEPTAINYGGISSSTFNFAILVRSGVSSSINITVSYGDADFVHRFTTLNETYLFLLQFEIPSNVIPTDRLIITFPANSVVTLLKYETVRSDYFTGFSSGGDFQDGYTTGYSAGLAESTTSAYDQGYEEGYDVGYDEGFDTGAVQVGDYRYAEGYSDGLRTADEGTWFSFVSAFIDVPITVITSYLDFDILGLNLLKFVKACVSFMLFFAVLKLLIGKVK